MARKQRPATRDDKLRWSAEQLAFRAMCVRHRDETIRMLRRVGLPTERRFQLEAEQLVRQDEFLQRLYDGARPDELDEERHLVQEEAPDGQLPPSLGRPPLSLFWDPPLLGRALTCRWLWGAKCYEIEFCRSAVFTAVDVVIRLDAGHGIDLVVRGDVAAPDLDVARQTTSHDMQGCLLKLGTPADNCQQIAEMVFLWKTIMEGYQVKRTKMASHQIRPAILEATTLMGLDLSIDNGTAVWVATAASGQQEMSL